MARATATKRYWLMKSEPNVYSIADLKREGATCWDGVRNYQARNFMRDDMKLGDEVLFYHSNTDPMGVYGIAKIVREAYPDHTAFDPTDKHYDPKSDAANPTWMMVDVGYVGTFIEPVTLATLKQTPGLEKMAVVQRGSRLSVQPVTPEEWAVVMQLGKLA
ncbi:MAG: EVE domain-containing protein [Candidatus Tectimicrobiota bacterium]